MTNNKIFQRVVCFVSVITMLIPKQVERLIHLRKMSFGYRPIAKDLGCSVSTVQRWCKKLGLTKNPRYNKKTGNR